MENMTQISADTDHLVSGLPQQSESLEMLLLKTTFVCVRSVNAELHSRSFTFMEFQTIPSLNIYSIRIPKITNALTKILKPIEHMVFRLIKNIYQVY